MKNAHHGSPGGVVHEECVVSCVTSGTVRPLVLCRCGFCKPTPGPRRYRANLSVSDMGPVPGSFSCIPT